MDKPWHLLPLKWDSIYQVYFERYDSIVIVSVKAQNPLKELDLVLVNKLWLYKWTL